MMDKQGSKIQVIDRAFELLDALSRDPDGITLTELTSKTGLHKATVLRFLKSLEHNGVVEQERVGKLWTIGAGLYEIVSRSSRGNDLREIARPFMETACREIGETIQLGILGGGEVIFVEKVEPEDLELRINTQVGTRRPIYCTALGKVLVANMPWNEVATMLRESGMQPKTERTIVEPDKYRLELEKVRQNGYAVDNREYNDLVICAAVPLRNASGRTIGSLSISSFGTEINSEKFFKIVEVASNAGERISEKLGHRAVA